jgi:hypothetical protein
MGAASYAALRRLLRLVHRMAPTEDEGPRRGTVTARLRHCRRTLFYHFNPCMPAPLTIKGEADAANRGIGNHNTITEPNITLTPIIRSSPPHSEI